MFNKWLIIGLLTLSMPSTFTLACAWEEPNDAGRKLKMTDYDEGGLPFFSPSNDSRLTMEMLINDYNPQSLIKQPQVPYEKIDGKVEKIHYDDSGRLSSNINGSKDFIAAVKSATGLKEDERAKLSSARMAMWPAEQNQPFKVPADVDEVSSLVGKQFANYLAGVAAFYNGEFTVAAQQFAALHNSDQPWLRETSRYMTARVDLNRAQTSLFNEFGMREEPSKEALDALSAADADFHSYLKDYPAGMYSASAQGLLRKVYWLSKQPEKLTNEYSQLIAKIKSQANFEEICDEVNNKVNQQDLGKSKDPILLAMYDLMSMRDSSEENNPFSLTTLTAQQPLFSPAHKPLYDYLLAAYAFYVQKEPAHTLSLLPKDFPSKGPLTNLNFSQLMLRGLALEDLKDQSAAAFWLKLLPLAKQGQQRNAIELALAMNYERNNKLAEVFKPTSPIQQKEIREILLRQSADANLLRQQWQSRQANEEERNTALYTLLYKEATRGQFQALAQDLKWVPTNLTKGTLADFNFSGTTKNYTCPSLQQIVLTLAKNSQDINALLCYSEFFHLTGLRSDSHRLEFKVPQDELGGAGHSGFAEESVTPGEIYKSIIKNPKATREQRSYALYRAVNCYAPSGVNECGGTDVDVDQRKLWFDTLKKDYPKTRWARELKYYW